jgi:peroxiredoxin
VMDLSMDTSPCMAGPPPFTEDARREALLLPRLRREDPPRQVLIGRNGDLLRGELEGITATHLAFRSGLENFNVPVERVAAAVWLIVPPKPEPKKDEPAPKPDKQKEDEILAPDSSGDAVFIVVKAAPPPLTEKKESKPEPKKDEKKQEAVKPGLQWLDLTNGGRLALKVDAWTADTVNGTHPLLGKLRIPRRLVHHFSLKEPPPPAALTALSEWKLEPTPDPVPPEGDGTESPLAGKPAADFKLPMLEGEDFELSKAKGKVVVLDFWATWCGPCVKSLPGLIEAMSEFPPEDVQFLAVNQGESKEQVKKFLSGRGWQMPVAFDADQKVAQKFGVEGIPYTVVIDREGNIAFTKTGAEPNGEKKIADAVQKALDAPGPEKEKKEEKDAPKAKPDDSLLPEPKGI